MIKAEDLNPGQRPKIVGSNRECLFCHEPFIVKRGMYKKKFCSHYCYGENKVGIPHTKEHNIKIAKALSGKQKSPTHRSRVIEARKLAYKLHPEFQPEGERHWAWKGDSVGYCGLHNWARRRLPQPKTCQKCGVENKKIGVKKKLSYLHLSNLSGLYKRDLTDWSYLCPKCHSVLDKGRNSIKNTFTDLKRK